MEMLLLGFLFFIIYSITAVFFLYLIYKISSRKTAIRIYRIIKPVSIWKSEDLLRFSLLIFMLFFLILLVFFALSTDFSLDSRIVLIPVACAVSVLFWLGYRNGACDVR